MTFLFLGELFLSSNMSLPNRRGFRLSVFISWTFPGTSDTFGHGPPKNEKDCSFWNTKEHDSTHRAPNHLILFTRIPSMRGRYIFRGKPESAGVSGLDAPVTLGLLSLLVKSRFAVIALEPLL